MGMKGLGKGEGVLVGAGKDKEFVGSLRRVGFLGKEFEGLFKVPLFARGLDQLIFVWC